MFLARPSNLLFVHLIKFWEVGRVVNLSATTRPLTLQKEKCVLYNFSKELFTMLGRS